MIQFPVVDFRSAASKFYLCFLLAIPIITTAQDIITPPSIGQKTKGAPATTNESLDKGLSSSQSTPQKSQQKEVDYGLLGRTEINEQRRESGQIYRIELKHSSGSTQYIEENDSDGKLESTSNDIEETPNLAKWRIGSW